MRDITYTLNKEDLKKAGIVFIKKGNLYKKEFVISEIITGIITGAIAFCITYGRCSNDKIAVFTVLAAVFGAIIARIIKMAEFKSILKDEMKNQKEDSKVTIHIEGKNIKVTENGKENEFKISEGDILDYDNDRVYIAFKKGITTYIPNSAFKDNNEKDEFIRIFDK